MQCKSLEINSSDYFIQKYKEVFAEKNWRYEISFKYVYWNIWMPRYLFVKKLRD